jgi:uncharacterized protein HemX
MSMSESNKQKPATESAPTKSEAPKVETTQAANETTTKKEPSKKPKRNSGLIAWIIVVILAAAIIVAMWFGYTRVWPMHQQQIASMAAQQDATATTISQLQGRLDEMEQAVSTTVRSSVERLEQRVESQLGRQQQRLDDYQLAVQSVQAELANLDISQESNWRIFEARNLTEQASTKLWIENDADAARAFLELAESHIIALDNPAHMPVRQALANDIAMLKQLPDSQIEAVSLQLGTLRDQVSRSQWYQQLAMSSAEASNSTEDNWLSHLKRSLNTLMQQFIRVQRRDTPVEPMIADAYFDVLQQRVLLQLQLAQQAAVTGSQLVYEANINEAIELLTSLQGQVNDADLNRFVDELQTLKATQLRPDYPSELTATAQLERLAKQVAQTNQGG